MGEGTGPFKRTSEKFGVLPEKIIEIKEATVDGIVTRILDLVPDRTIIVGMGNIAAIGMEIVAYFEKQSQLCRQPVEDHKKFQI